MAAIARNILDTIGNTPLVSLGRLCPGPATLLAKIEAFNPGGSAKDRVGLAMVEAAEKQGLLQPGGLIIEPTSGNTGLGLAIASAVKGYRLVLTMPDTMSVERRRLAAAYGAEIVLTPGAEGMAGAIAKANELHDATPNSIIPQQFENPANPDAHYRTTGPEIWRDTDGHVDAFVASVGTGGTLTGTGRFLREHNPALEIVAVEPADSPLLSGGKAAPHQLQGIGANFIPAVLDTTLISRVFPVTTEQAGQTARALASREGILAGISSGATLYAALQLAQSPDYDGKTIVAVLPDTGERYLSTWLFA